MMSTNCLPRKTSLHSNSSSSWYTSELWALTSSIWTSVFFSGSSALSIGIVSSVPVNGALDTVAFDIRKRYTIKEVWSETETIDVCNIILTCEFTFLVCEELRWRDVCWEKDHWGKSYQDCRDAFQDEDPSPSSLPSYTIHLYDCRCQKPYIISSLHDTGEYSDEIYLRRRRTKRRTHRRFRLCDQTSVTFLKLHSYSDLCWSSWRLYKVLR